MSDKYITVCNFAEGTQVFSAGARAYVRSTGKHIKPKRISVEVTARSRGGRWVTAWVSAKKLKNFRRATISPGHPLYEWSDRARDQMYWRRDPARLNQIAQDVSDE